MSTLVKVLKRYKQYDLPAELEPWAHVSVVWEDVKSHSGTYKAHEFLSNVKQCIRRTAGYVLYYGDDYIVTAATDDRSANVDDDCEDITVIPLAYVRKISHAR